MLLSSGTSPVLGPALQKTAFLLRPWSVIDTSLHHVNRVVQGKFSSQLVKASQRSPVDMFKDNFKKKNTLINNFVRYLHLNESSINYFRNSFTMQNTYSCNGSISKV